MLKVSNIAVSLDEKDYAKVIANTLNIRKSQVKNVKIAKKAVDARRKNKVHFNMGFTFEYVDEDQLLKTHSKQVSKVKEYHYDKLTPNNQTIMVVGSGPAGLFCAYNLARSGQKVILIEQGKCVDERKKDIKELYPEFDNELIEELASIKGVSAYHSLSFKAMHIINKEMLTTEMNQIQVLHEIEMFDKNRKSLKGKKNIEPDEEAILSPVAKRAHRETFKVINALRKKYGEFDSIVIEMTRDKNTREQTKRINDNQKRFENINKEVDDIIKNAGIDPEEVNGKTKTKVRLYLQQDCKTAYTQQDIDLHTLIFDDKAYEIDHIIPISVSLDDSLSNKILASRLENQQKGNLTPMMAYLKGI